MEEKIQQISGSSILINAIESNYPTGHTLSLMGTYLTHFKHDLFDTRY